jgi:hypothetical protein
LTFCETVGFKLSGIPWTPNWESDFHLGFDHVPDLPIVVAAATVAAGGDDAGASREDYRGG